MPKCKADAGNNTKEKAKTAVRIPKKGNFHVGRTMSFGSPSHIEAPCPVSYGNFPSIFTQRTKLS